MALKTPKSLREFEAGAIENPTIVERFPVEGLDELLVDVTTVGTLAIFFDATHEATVIIDGDEHLLPDRVERVGSQVIIEGRNVHNDSINGHRHRLVMEVHLPVKTRITVDFSFGQVILSGGEGDVDICGKFGEIAGITHAKRVNAEMKCGAITLNELAGIADVHLSMGGVTLGWTELTGEEDITIDCGMGGVDLLLPPGAVPSQSRGGMSPKTRVRTAAGTTIEAKVGMGGLEVKDWSGRN